MPDPTSTSANFHPLWVVALITIFFASLARVLRGVSLSGAVAGGVVCLMLYGSAGPGAFLLLVLLFMLTWSATRIGYQHKQKLGIAEKKEGRTASQILANIGVAAICALAVRWHGNTIFLPAMCAALAEAGADTVSSEIGQIYSREARLITSWRKVKSGTNGGISFAGTLAGVGAALLLTLAGVFTGLMTVKLSVASFIAACIGMICDSYLGATLESRRLLSNNGVNFLSTLASGLVTVAWQLLSS